MKTLTIFIILLILAVLGRVWVERTLTQDAQRACLVQGMEGCK